jgi:flagellar protein FlaF
MMSYQGRGSAYQQTQNVAESPRQTEYRLFAQVTRALIEADEQDTATLTRAVHWNRRLWMALQADCASDENRLPDEIRAGIISLAIWVDKHSRKVMRREAGVEPLVDVNRTIMQGLTRAPQQRSEDASAMVQTPSVDNAMWENGYG